MIKTGEESIMKNCTHVMMFQN
jgi:hypothetical protein